MISDFQILGKVGAGPMLLAKDKSGNKKVLKPYQASLEDCFDADQLMTLKALNYEQISSPSLLFEDSGKYYAVYDYIKGDNLEEYIKKRRFLSEKRIHKIIKSIADEYAILRNNNLFHGNIKPQNIMIEEKEGMIIKLTDFLIKRKKTWKNESYCSPETITKFHSEKFASDIWSIGAIMKFILKIQRCMISLILILWNNV